MSDLLRVPSYCQSCKKCTQPRTRWIVYWWFGLGNVKYFINKSLYILSGGRLCVLSLFYFIIHLCSYVFLLLCWMLHEYKIKILLYQKIRKHWTVFSDLVSSSDEYWSSMGRFVWENIVICGWTGHLMQPWDWQVFKIDY